MPGSYGRQTYSPCTGFYADDSESLIESEAELESTIKGGYQIGIEVGFASVMDHAARMKQQ